MSFEEYKKNEERYKIMVGKMVTVNSALHDHVYSMLPNEVGWEIKEFLNGMGSKRYRNTNSKHWVEFSGSARKDFYSRGFNDQDIVEWLNIGQPKGHILFPPYVSNNFKPRC